MDQVKGVKEVRTKSKGFCMPGGVLGQRAAPEPARAVHRAGRTCPRFASCDLRVGLGSRIGQGLVQERSRTCPGSVQDLPRIGLGLGWVAHP
eukprot:351582-Chlamydomonas_euryale.AAC.4